MYFCKNQCIFFPHLRSYLWHMSFQIWVNSPSILLKPTKPMRQLRYFHTTYEHPQLYEIYPNRNHAMLSDIQYQRLSPPSWSSFQATSWRTSLCLWCLSDPVPSSTLARLGTPCRDVVSLSPLDCNTHTEILLHWHQFPSFCTCF